MVYTDMKMTAHLLILGLLILSPAIIGKETKGTFSMEVTRTVTYPYLVITPEDFDAEQPAPLMLFLHGAGERGDDLLAVKKHGPFSKLKELEINCILLVPQCPPGEGWVPEVLAGLLDEVEARYVIDSSRIYVTGLSMGGHATWALAGFQPERFAAIAPICARGRSEDAAKLAGVSIWAFHGDADRVVPLERAQAMIDTVKAAGGEPRFTIYPDAGHDAWTPTYNDPEFYSWLFSQKLP
ncbi:MAG: prolyl oligopeptidase family serine peptidase [Opitutales bacterium]|nr:prolyl oligopeptidase family serine peptidase [Opitutales bacterium]